LLKEPIKGKLVDQYTGPHEVLEILDNNNIKIAISKDRTQTVHGDKLKKLRCIGGAHLPDDTPYPGPSRHA